MSQGHTGIAGVIESPSTNADAPSDHKSRSLRFVTVEIRRGGAKLPFTFAYEDAMKLMDLLANGSESDRADAIVAIREKLKG